MIVSRKEFEAGKWRVGGRLGRGSRWMNVVRTEFEGGESRVGERVRSGGVTLDECESDRV